MRGKIKDGAKKRTVTCALPSAILKRIKWDRKFALKSVMSNVIPCMTIKNKKKLKLKSKKKIRAKNPKEGKWRPGGNPSYIAFSGRISTCTYYIGRYLICSYIYKVDSFFRKISSKESFYGNLGVGGGQRSRRMNIFLSSRQKRVPIWL